MSYKNDGERALLGKPRQLRSAFTHLGDASRRRFQRFGVHRLDRIDHDHIGTLHTDGVDDGFELHLGQKLDCGIDETEPMRAQRDLLHRFLAGHV